MTGPRVRAANGVAIAFAGTCVNGEGAEVVLGNMVGEGGGGKLTIGVKQAIKASETQRRGGRRHDAE